MKTLISERTSTLERMSLDEILLYTKRVLEAKGIYFENLESKGRDCSVELLEVNKNLAAYTQVARFKFFRIFKALVEKGCPSLKEDYMEIYNFYITTLSSSEGKLFETNTIKCLGSYAVEVYSMGNRIHELSKINKFDDKFNVFKEFGLEEQ